MGLLQSVPAKRIESASFNPSTSSQRTLAVQPNMPPKKSKAKKKKGRSENKTTYMFPSLHQDVLDALAGQIPSARFHSQDTNQGSTNNWSTNIMGRFQCPNNACAQGGWGSKVIAILIRGYPGNRYNAVVFNQRCKSCNELGTMTLDEDSYVERVAYWVKKWAGVHTERPVFVVRRGPPHESELCEGCKRGVCRRANAWE